MAAKKAGSYSLVRKAMNATKPAAKLPASKRSTAAVAASAAQRQAARTGGKAAGAVVGSAASALGGAAKVVNRANRTIAGATRTAVTPGGAPRAGVTNAVKTVRTAAGVARTLTGGRDKPAVRVSGAPLPSKKAATTYAPMKDPAPGKRPPGVSAADWAVVTKKWNESPASRADIQKFLANLPRTKAAVARTK